MLNSFSRKMMDPIKDTFLYFAYGSNLFKKRIRINNPTAEFLGVGRLDVSFALKRYIEKITIQF